MALLFLGEPDQNGIAFVSSIVYQPQYLDEEIRAQGVEVDEGLIPTTSDPDKDIVLKFNVNRHEFVVEQVERPPSPEKVQKDLQEENKQLGQQVSGLEIQLLQKDQDIKVIAQQLSELEIEVLKIKQTGGTVQ
ncbi:hypothetical protein [Bacillus cereus]|uniref:hypothetical protein n=1 Tax=Bacillus cereus TaxID=1396 RepID=UPI00382D8AD4